MPDSFETEACVSGKKPDSTLRGRTVRLVGEGRSESLEFTAPSAAVACQISAGHQSVCRRALPANSDDGTCDGVTSLYLAKI